MSDMSDKPAPGASGSACTSTCLKVGVGFAAFAMVCVVFVGALLLYGTKTGGNALREYFAATKDADVPTVVGTFRDELKALCDPQMLALLVKAVPARYGDFKEPKTNGFNFSDELHNGTRLQKYSGTMVFERGELPMEVHFADGKLLTFKILPCDEAKVLVESLGVPPDLAPYAATGERFWRATLTNQVDDAWNLLSEPLQKNIGKQGFTVQCRNLSSNGALKGVDFIRPVRDPEQGDRVHVLYRVVAEQAKAVGHVTFQFAGVSSYLIAFQIPSPYATEADSAATTVPAGDTN